MTFLLALLGCGARAPVAPATWVEVEPGKAICLSGFPGAPELGRRDARTFDKLLGTLEQGQVDDAGRWLSELPEEHPAVEGASAVLDLVHGELGATVEQLDALSQDHPEDACLGSTAALALWASGEFDRAALRLRDARTRAPNDGHIAFLSWFLALEPAAALLPALEAGVAAHPDDPGLRLALGAVHLELSDAASAVPHLEAARDSGMTDAEGPLLQAYFLAGQRGPYLREASRLGLPLGDHGAIADAEDPVAAYDALLGMAPGQTLQAVLHTTLGDLTCTLLPEVAPVTVANFVGLARGTITWVHPATGLQLNTPLYDGTVFHRVIPDFMIQGGDPLGQGVGDPGYNFIDELDGRLSFDRPGLLAMANKGPHTNGSQFFVTESAAPHLDGLHTIFGTCDERSVDVVRNIARVPVDDYDSPIEPVVLEHVEIQIRTGEDG